MPKIVVVQPSRATDVVVGVEQGARYTLTNADGSRAVLNDPTDLDHVGFLTEPPTGIDSPEVRATGEDYPEADGGTNGPTFYGRRPWALSGIVDPTPSVALDYSDNPTELGRNLAPNPRFEGGLGGVSGWNGATVAIGTAFASDGPSSLRVTYTKSSAVAEYPGVTFTVPVAEGTPVELLATVGITAAPAGLVLNLQGQWKDASGTTLSFTPGATLTAQGAATLLDLPALTAPLGAVALMVTIYFTFPASTTGSIDFAVDGIGVLTNGVPYFTGATPDADGLQTTWTAAPELSPSIMYALNRTLNPPGQVANRRITKLQRAWRALRGDVTLSWTAAGGVDVFLTGRLATKPVVGQRLPKTFAVGFMAAERRILSRALASITAAATSSITARNVGNTVAPATITLMGAFVNPSLTNVQTGEVIYLDADGGLTMVAGDVLVVDLAAKTITLNGQDRYSKRRFPGTTWWELAPLDNVLQVTGAGSGASWRVDWRQAWE